jgi:hypothetical protein
MSPRMWFTLVLRGLGAYEFLNGLSSAVTALNVYFGYFNGSATTMAFVNHAVGSCTVGALLAVLAARVSALLVPPLPEKPADGASPANV